MKTTRKVTEWLLTLALLLVLAPAMAGNAKAAADYHIVWAAGTSDGDSPRIGYVGNDTNQPISFTAWNGVPTSSGNYYLTGDVELNEQWMITNNVTINLCLNGHSIISKIDDVNSAVIKILGLSTLNLYDVSGDNGKVTHYYDAGLSHRYNGGGVSLTGTFNMYGGSIADNDGIGSDSEAYGGGVHVISGTFNLYGGSITNNRAYYSGGVYIGRQASSVTFNMYGGTISGNTATGNGGGGVFVENRDGAVFRMAGGTISSNTVNSSSNDVRVNGSGKFIYSGGTVGNVTGTQTTGVTITFNANGGSGTMPPQIVEQSSSGTVTLNGNGGFSRVGYDFAGWLANSGDTDTITTVVPSSSKTVYAKWTPINYTISYTLNGGSVASANPTSYNIKTSTFNLNNPTRDYYNFAGWTGTGLSGEVTNVTVEMGSTGDRSYTATWTPISYAITYNLAGGSVTPANPTSYTYETAAFTLNNPTRDGYRFTGWTGTGLSGATASVTVAAHSTGARSYTATWAQLYGVTVENGTADATDAAENDVVTITADAAPAGKLFDKWTSADGVVFDNENAETTTFSMPAQAVTVTANYKNAPTPPAPPAGGGNSAPPEPFRQTLPAALVFDGGKVAISPVSAGIGDTVTLTVTPDAGKKLESLVIDRIGSEPLPYEDKGGGVYEFEMPGWRLAFRATFVPDVQPEPEQQPLPSGNVAGVVLSPQTITVNGAAVKVEAYNIGGTNYFMLRDLAALLSGTSAQFNVEFDADRDAVVITRGATYNGAVNTNFTDRSGRTAPSQQSVEIDGQRVSLTAYNIGGNNFFGLRELSTLLGYGVAYDEANNTAVIESK